MIGSTAIGSSDARTIVDASLRVADHIQSRVPLFTSRGEWATRQYGAAAVVRGCELLRASIVCLDAGHLEAIGLLTRALFESWTTGAYVMFGGREALGRLHAERWRQERHMMQVNGVRADDLVAERDAEIDEIGRVLGIKVGEDGRPKWDGLTVMSMAEQLDSLIPAAMSGGEEVLVIYRTVYRSYSTFDTHGLSPLERLLDMDDIELISMRSPTPWNDPVASIALSCLLLARLANWVFDEFRISTAPLLDDRNVVEQVLRRASDVNLQAAPQRVKDALPESVRALLD